VVLVLGYVILVQVMAACIVLLCQFVLLQWRALKTLLSQSQEPPRPLPSPAREVHQARGDEAPQVIIGGGLRKW
jgi:hypothetical protein